MEIHFYVFGRELVSGDQVRYETLCGVFVESSQLAMQENEVTCAFCRSELPGPIERLRSFVTTGRPFPFGAAAGPSLPAQYSPKRGREA